MPRATKITDADVAWQSVPNAIDHVKWYKNKGMLKLLFYISIIYTVRPQACGRFHAADWTAACRAKS